MLTLPRTVARAVGIGEVWPRTACTGGAATGRRPRRGAGSLPDGLPGLERDQLAATLFEHEALPVELTEPLGVGGRVDPAELVLHPGELHVDALGEQQSHQLSGPLGGVGSRRLLER